jgi:hypothetical protein
MTRYREILLSSENKTGNRFSDKQGSWSEDPKRSCSVKSRIQTHHQENPKKKKKKKQKKEKA